MPRSTLCFFDLPYEFMHEQIIPLLCIVSLCKFDAAVCAHQNRPHFLKSILGTQVSLNACKSSTQIPALRWMKSRGLLARDFSAMFNKKCLKWLNKQKVLSQFKKLKSLYVEKKCGTRIAFEAISDSISDGSLVNLNVAGKQCKDYPLGALMVRQRTIETFCIHRTSNTDDLLRYLAAHCPALEKLWIKDCQYITLMGDGLRELCSNCSHLRVFEILNGFEQVTPTMFSPIGEFCKNLEYLNLSDSAVTDKSIQPVLVGCPKLKYLRLRHTCVTAIGLAEIARLCIHLSSLYLDLYVEDSSIVDSFKLLSRSLEHFHGQLHSEVARQSAVHWGARMREVDFSSFVVTDELVQCIAMHCVNLTHFAFEDHTGVISDAALVSISDHCPQLKVLFIRNGQKITDNGAIALARGCPELQRLTVSGTVQITPSAVETLLLSCPRLETIYTGLEY